MLKAAVHLDRLTSLGGVRGVAFGHYSEMSADGHELLAITADQLAASRWRLMGARSYAEARAFYIQQIRRQLGLLVGREFARHRLRRLPFIGVPRAAVRARIAERDAFHPQPIQIGYQAPAFYGFQAQAGARDVVAARA